MSYSSPLVPRLSSLLILFLFCIKTINAQTTELIGEASAGGRSGVGTIFKINSDGTAFDTLYCFDKSNTTVGFTPVGKLMKANDGKWYGILSKTSTSSDSGALFGFDLATHSCKRIFAYSSHKGTPSYGNIVIMPNGKLYLAVSSDSVGCILCYNPDDNTHKVVLDFATTDGKLPYGGLVYAKNGKLYGMTAYGGAHGEGELFWFNLSNNKYKKVFDFGGVNGLHPWGNLIQAKDGKLYGMTSGGGINDTDSWNHGDGVIFCFDPSNDSYKKLYDLKWSGGATPQGTLLQAANSKLYGLTWYGGDKSHGVVFVFNPADNTYTDIYDFNDIDGSYPHGNLIQVNNNLYGMTTRGGAHNCGVIFLIDTTNDSYKKICDFERAKGALPFGDLSEVK